jgi:U3 small nucleolar RNA-associated protein 25
MGKQGMKGGKKGGKDKKKKKKGSAKTDDWSLDGGVGLTGEDQQGGTEEEKGEKRKRRETQEKDEAIRRGHLKSMDFKNKRSKDKKMAKKIKYSDVFGEEEVVKEVKVKFVKPKLIRPTSGKSVIDRLRSFVDTSSHNINKKVRIVNEDGISDSDEDDDDDEEEEDDDEDNDEDNDEYELNEDGEYDINDDDDEQELKEEELEKQVDEQDNDSGNDDEIEEETLDNDDDNDDETNKGSYDWFFSSDSKSSTNKMEKLTSFDNYEVYGNINSNVNPQPIKKLGDIPGLYKLWKTKRKTVLSNIFSSQLLPYLSNYTDALIEGRDHNNDNDMLRILMTHVCTHIVSARAKQIKHNIKLKKRASDQLIAVETLNASVKSKSKKNKNKDKLLTADSAIVQEGMQDQGFCRPRILILCPLRNSAKECIDMIHEILGSNTNVSNLEKLHEEFDEIIDSDDDGEERKPNINSKKPDDWNAIFKGNIDDDFKMGIQVNPGQGKGNGSDKGVYLRLFSDFFQSDIIIASPLGLRLVVEGKSNKINFDFLSSLEMIVLHQADIMYMQSWEHVGYILNNTNKLPTSDKNGTDYSRVRPYFLEEQGNKHRQLIITSNFNEPSIQSLFREHGVSIAGTIRLKKNWGEGVIPHVVSRVKQVFQVIPTHSFELQADERFEYFKDVVLSQILTLNQGHTLIVTPSYLDYVRVRNELIRKDVSNYLINILLLLLLLYYINIFNFVNDNYKHKNMPFTRHNTLDDPVIMRRMII